MSKLDELIKELCPNGVEYKPFGELATIVRGASPRPIKNFITTDEYGVNWIKIGDVKPGSKYITETAEKITLDGAKKSRFVKEGDFILSNSMSFGRPYIMKTQGCIHDGWLAISDFDNCFISDFLYHLLNSNKYQQMMKQKASFGGAVQNLNADIVRELEMPIVPLPIQQEIVRILDSFTELTAELQQQLDAELTARKKQYEYYKNNILQFDETVKRYVVKEVCDTITNFAAAGSFADVAENVPYLSEPSYAQLIRTADIKSNYTHKSPIYISEHSYKFLWRVQIEEPCIVLPSVGNCGEVYYVDPVDLPYPKNALAKNALLVRSSNVNIKFLRFVFESAEFQKQLSKVTSNMGQSKFNKTDFEKILIPVPDESCQNEIVDRLEKFEILCNDLSSGLPAEIEARQKQYEYYRDKLLSFPPAE